jgi:hypothetical protein
MEDFNKDTEDYNREAEARIKDTEDGNRHTEARIRALFFLRRPYFTGLMAKKVSIYKNATL